MSDILRVVTYNVLTIAEADGPARHRIMRRVFPGLGADIVALQEVTRGADSDQVAELLGSEFTVVDLPGGSSAGAGECLATRLPVAAVHALDVPVSGEGPQAVRATAVAVEVLAPQPIGSVLVVHHRGTFELPFEHARERQAVATARFVEELAADRDELPVVLLGDLNAATDAASVRFLTGKQSLDGFSVRYEDAWAAVHGDRPGHTFSPRNPLVRAGQLPSERGRRIDHVLVRSGAYGPALEVADCRMLFTDPVDGVWLSDHFGLLADLRRPEHRPGHWAEDVTG
ncbi:endonuclease/exonuclease/phosphatase family protein [Actinophytocola oryzae]|nr:endonuclease/exonuclease/phosphatase family protein [Actinophytocola oryzae]